MLVYTYYNSRHMDYSAQPAMKYMQYAMPLMFMGFFNSYASGLTAYLNVEDYDYKVGTSSGTADSGTA